MPITPEGKIVPIRDEILVPDMPDMFVPEQNAGEVREHPSGLVLVEGGASKQDLPLTDISGIEFTHNEALNFYLASMGYDAKSASDKLGVAESTVKTHRASTLGKLHAHTMQGAVAKAILLGKLEIQYLPEDEQRELTDDQVEIIEIVALDFRYDEVAGMVHKSLPTIKSHTANLRRILNAKNIPHAVRLAFENKVITAAGLNKRTEVLKSQHAA